jgi:arsenate reductase (thioredoxin)
MISQADRTITMGFGADAGAACPASFIKTEDWALPDPEGKSLEDMRRIRDEIEAKVLRFAG